MDVMEQIRASFEDYDEDLLVQALEAGLDTGTPPMDLVNRLSAVLEEIGELFSQGELFLPDMVLAGDMMEAAMAVLNPALAAQNGAARVNKKVVLGTVRGDIHDIGKNMVKMMVQNSGFEVFDLGVDVSPETFYHKALEVEADVLALSSTMTTTVPGMRDTIELVRAKKLDERCAIMVGGGSLNPELAKELGAHLHSGDAYDAARVLKEYFKKEASA